MNGQPPENRPRQGMDYGETEEVQATHAAIYREKVEPRVGREPLSLWLIATYGLAVFFGGAYLGRYAGNFGGDGLDYMGGAPRVMAKASAGGSEQAAELTPVEKGKKIYSANCATCHQANGIGVAGQYPPLAGSEWVDGSTKRLGMILLKGLQGPVTVKGQKYGSAVMQPWEKTLNDQKIADVLTYIRQEWGNKGAPVAAEGIGALRKEIAGRTELYTEAELLAVPNDVDVEGGAPPAPADGAATPGANPPTPNP